MIRWCLIRGYYGILINIAYRWTDIDDSALSSDQILESKFYKLQRMMQMQWNIFYFIYSWIRGDYALHKYV